MDNSEIVEQINNVKGFDCFEKPEETEFRYLESLNLPEEVLNFYAQYSPAEIIEMNGIRLLPISEIIEENTNFTPGYILTPLGFCVVASTVEGDIYCIRKTTNDYSIVIASHDEIYEGLNESEILNGTKPVVKTFSDFFKAYVQRELAVSYYDLEIE